MIATVLRYFRGARHAGAPAKRKMRGEDLFLRDVATAGAGYAFRTVFDVGANVGKVSLFFRDRCPGVVIHAFEPAPEAFAVLRQELGDAADCSLNPMALGAAKARLFFGANGVATTNRLLHPSEVARRADVAIEVEVATGDGYCRDRGVDHISFLKIDTEGHDLDVLVGFEAMLRAQKIDFVQVEAGMNPENKRHVALERMKAHFEDRGYRLFRLYEQRSEKLPLVLRRTNAVFVSLKCANERARP